MTVITCSLDFPEFQTWLHNDWGGVLPVAITGQVQPPGDLDQSRSDRHNTTALESGEKQIHLSSASLPPPPDVRRAVGEQEVKPLCGTSILLPLIILQTLQLLLRLLPPPPLEPAGP